MLGMMQDWPLLCHKVIDYAATEYGTHEIVARSVEGPIVRTNYSNVRQRALKCAKRLQQSGIKMGDRIGTIAWNTPRHLESWYGIMGIGAVYHTVNPRLFPEQISWIVNHAEDRMMFTDLTFVAILEKIADQMPSVEQYIIYCAGKDMPETSLKNAVAYEDWLDETDDDFAWVSFDENTAAGICYTSGTTGDPKGVVYSHRGNLLHALVANSPDMMNFRSTDAIMPVVPLFHANGWGIAYTAPMAGSKMVMPGAAMDGASIYELLDTEKVTATAAVPTVWLMLLGYLQETGKMLPHLERVIIGGSACPRSMTEAFENIYDVRVVHAWGMTEMSPLGTICTLKPHHYDLPKEKQIDVQEKQGRLPFGVEMKIVNDEGERLPYDGKTFGRLLVRGPAIAKTYMKGAGGDILDDEGYFDTGDVAHVDPDGYMQITDRSKDVIKSGGEWISSIDLENLAVGHPDVVEAAVIGIVHPKWDERPLLVVIRTPGSDPSKEDILNFMSGKIAKWWMPDDVAFVDEIPHTATGKIQKTALRETFKDYVLPTA